MAWDELLRQGAALIQGNADPATSNLDAGQLTAALGAVLGGGDGQLDLAGLVSRFSGSGLSDVVASWVGSGSNLPISAEQIQAALGSDVVSQFAGKLGISEGSAAQALADAVPNLVDRATSQDSGLAGQLLEQVGGVDGAMDMLKKLF